MDQHKPISRFGNGVTSAWRLWRSSFRSQTAEAWEHAFVAEGSSGSGYAPPQNSLRVVFLGDSLTAAWDLQRLMPSLDVVNAGVGGDLLSQMRERWRGDVLARDAGIVHLLGGTNNITRGYSQGFMQRDVVRMAKLAEISKMRLVIGLLPPMRGARARLNPRVRDFNLWLRIFGEERGFAVADYYSPLADAEGELRADLAETEPDGKLDTVHLNSAAYELMTPIARNASEKVTGRM